MVDEKLRVAFLADSLTQRGAEKQMFYMIQALQEVNIDVRVYTLVRGGYYDKQLQEIGISPVEIGRGSNLESPSRTSYLINHMMRLSDLGRELRDYRPHVLQSAHTKTNIYLGFARYFLRQKTIGGVRVEYSLIYQYYGKMARWVIQAPEILILNSVAATRQIEQAKLRKTSELFLVPNVIHLPDFDASPPSNEDFSGLEHRIKVFFVGHLAPQKRLDRFLEALSIARQSVPALYGIVIGDGSERMMGERLALELGLSPDDIVFLGHRDDVSGLLRCADIQVLTSDAEGFPNVILEGMASGLPIITTISGDTSIIVKHGVTGYVSSSAKPVEIADYLIQLAKSPDLRRELGHAGRKRVEQEYGFDNLARHLLTIYYELGQRSNTKSSRKLVEVLQKGYGPLLSKAH